eukprot:scaffold5907_cov30-Attheya_sp.AAC.1
MIVTRSHSTSSFACLNMAPMASDACSKGESHKTLPKHRENWLEPWDDHSCNQWQPKWHPQLQSYH